MASLTVKEKQSVAALSLMAAMADGEIKDGERALVNHTLVALDDAERGEVLSRVVTRQTSVTSELAQLTTESKWKEALAMAKKICEVDQGVNEREAIFLRQLEMHVSAFKGQTTESKKTDETLPVWTAEFASRAAAIRMLQHPFSSIWIATLRIQMARSIRARSRQSKQFSEYSEIRTLSRLLLLPDSKLVNQMRSSGIDFDQASPEFAFASTAALCHLLERYYIGNETLTAARIRVLFRNRFLLAIKEFGTHSDKIEEWLREGEPLSIAVRPLEPLSSL